MSPSSAAALAPRAAAATSRVFSGLNLGGLRPGGACHVCGSWCDGALCGSCRARFAAPRLRCSACATPLASVPSPPPAPAPAPTPAGAPPHCGACLRQPPLHTRCTCVADYGFPWDRLVQRLKFGASPELAPVLAGLMAEAAAAQGLALPQLFVPVPLSDTRLAERGYDQAWQLARRLARQGARPAAAQALQRRFDVRAQSALGRRERLANLRGAFAPGPQHAACRGRHVALVDDVTTTGATAHEAAATLLALGAARVDLWVFLRTPAPWTED